MTVDAQCRAVLIVFHFSDNTNICSFQVNICQFSDLTLLVDRKDICPVKKNSDCVSICSSERTNTENGRTSMYNSHSKSDNHWQCY